MASHKINIFLRLRPVKKAKCQYELLEDAQRMVVDTPKDPNSNEVRRLPSRSRFRRFAPMHGVPRSDPVELDDEEDRRTWLEELTCVQGKNIRTNRQRANTLQSGVFLVV